MAKKISIIIPVFNSSKYLKKCLDSIKRQEFSNWEAICIDDGSTDDSYSILMEYKQNDDRFKLFQQKNAGQSVARNFALTKATGDYISFVDSDDYIEPNFLQQLYKDICTKQAQIAISGVKYYNESGDKILKKSSDESRTMEFNEFMKELFRKNLFQEYLCDKLFSTELFKGIQLPENTYYEDTAIMSTLFERAKRISFNGSVYYCYRMHSNSSIHSFFSEKKKNLIKFRLNNVALSTKYNHAFDFETKTALLCAIHFTYLEICKTRNYNKWLNFATENESYIPKDIAVWRNPLVKYFDKPFVFAVQKLGFCPNILFVQQLIKKIFKSLT